MSPVQLEGDEGAEARYQALVEAGAGPGAAEVLVRALYDESWRIRKAAAELLMRLAPGRALLDRLIAVLGDRDQTGARNAAAMALAGLGAPAAAALETLLQHPDPDQRKFAADILGELRARSTAPALVRALADPDPNVRVSAAEALGRVGGQDAERALTRLLDSRDPLLQVCGLEGLAQLGRAPPLPKLLPHLEAPSTARSAFRLLGQIAHPAAFALLRRGLLTSARDAALSGLGARESELSPELEVELTLTLRRIPDLNEWLAVGLGSDERPVRRGALLAVRAASLAPLAVQVAGAAEGGALADEALAVLTRLGLAGARALLDGDPPALATLGREARSVAGEAVLKAAEPALVEALVALARAGDFELTELAARALGRSRSAEAVEPLAALLEDDAIASDAARALVTLAATVPAACCAALAAQLARRPLPHALRAYAQLAPAAEALPVLRRGSRDADERVRAAAAEASAALGVELLSTALADESPLVRRAAARALSQLPLSEALPLLQRALADLEPGVLTAAAVAAGELAAAAVAPRLEQLLQGSGAVALAALQALFSSGSLSTPLLAQATHHADVEVVKAALTFAAGRPEGVALSLEQLTHPRWDVRAEAARSLAVCGGAEAHVRLVTALAQEADGFAREAMAIAAASLAER